MGQSNIGTRFFYNFNGEIMAATNDMCFAHGLASHGLGLAVVESRQLLNPLLALNGHESIAIFCNLVNPFVFLRCQFFMIANCGSVSCSQLSMLCLSVSRRMTWMTMAENNGSICFRWWAFIWRFCFWESIRWSISHLYHWQTLSRDCFEWFGLSTWHRWRWWRSRVSETPLFACIGFCSDAFMWKHGMVGSLNNWSFHSFIH